MSILNDFQDWKQFLHDRVNQGEQLGMSKETISDLAYHIGEYLAKDVQPQNEQEQLLRELWEAADKDERQTMASLMVKMVDDGKR